MRYVLLVRAQTRNKMRSRSESQPPAREPGAAAAVGKTTSCASMSSGGQGVTGDRRKLGQSRAGNCPASSPGSGTARRVGINGDKGDDPVGDNGAVAPLDSLCQGEAGTPTLLRPGYDPQPIALMARRPVIEADVHHHRDRPQPLEAVV